jgi:hypothetical protein
MVWRAGYLRLPNFSAAQGSGTSRNASMPAFVSLDSSVA